MSRIETDNFYADQLGGSWIVRDKNRGEVLCFRPDEQTAKEAMNLLESAGVFVRSQSR